jgi:hypothetical protein
VLSTAVELRGHASSASESIGRSFEDFRKVVHALNAIQPAHNTELFQKKKQVGAYVAFLEGHLVEFKRIQGMMQASMNFVTNNA